MSFNTAVETLISKDQRVARFVAAGMVIFSSLIAVQGISSASLSYSRGFLMGFQNHLEQVWDEASKNIQMALSGVSMSDDEKRAASNKIIEREDAARVSLEGDLKQIPKGIADSAVQIQVIDEKDGLITTISGNVIEVNRGVLLGTTARHGLDFAKIRELDLSQPQFESKQAVLASGRGKALGIAWDENSDFGVFAIKLPAGKDFHIKPLGRQNVVSGWNATVRGQVVDFSLPIVLNSVSFPQAAKEHGAYVSREFLSPVQLKELTQRGFYWVAGDITAGGGSGAGKGLDDGRLVAITTAVSSPMPGVLIETVTFVPPNFNSLADQAIAKVK